MAATFDGTNLLITLEAPAGGLLSMNVQQDIYSDWKVWVKDSGGHAYQPAFDSTGGDPIPGSQFISGSYFLRNDLGWRIQTTDANQEVTLVGNLYPRDETQPMFMSRPTRTIAFNVDRTSSPRDLTNATNTLIAQDMGLVSGTPKVITENVVDSDYTETHGTVTKTVVKSGSTTTITRTS